MGFNTALMVLNDGLHCLDDDPDAGKRIYNMVLEACTGRRGEVFSTGLAIMHNGEARGSHGGVVSCLSSLHADELQIIAVGGNRIQYLGYGGGYSADPETMLRNLADQMGYRIVKKASRAR